MGINKWTMKHGLGSIGGSTRTILKVYKSAKDSLPKLDEDAYFFLTLELRREHVKKFVPQFAVYATPEQIALDVKAAKGDLSELVFQELHKEYPILNEVKINAPDLYIEAREIVDEVVRENK
ncbi:MAG: hypothetical protein Q8P80_05650 [Candidatus Levybacteria bacterium]|nr:hypothetical protein [Candidatus Levybacteria bacterium]